MIKHYSKAMNFYIITHLALLLIYYFAYSFLKLKEGDAFEVAKQMFYVFTAVNVIAYFVSNRVNEEKREGRQIKKESILYALITFEALAFGAAYLLNSIPIS